jgi:hypothetical protein
MKIGNTTTILHEPSNTDEVREVFMTKRRRTIEAEEFMRAVIHSGVDYQSVSCIYTNKYLPTIGVNIETISRECSPISSNWKVMPSGNGYRCDDVSRTSCTFTCETSE